MASEIQPADPAHRQRILLVMTAVAALIALGILYLDAYLLELQVLAQESYTTAALAARRATHVVFGLLLAGSLGLSGLLARTSWRTLKSRRHPPPGSRVISDTRVRTGRQARRHAQTGLIIAGLIPLLTVAVIALISQRIEPLLDTRLKPTPVSIGE